MNVSAAEIEEATVYYSAILKEDLYINYSEHKSIYDSGQINVEQADHLTTEYYESMKGEIQ